MKFLALVTSTSLVALLAAVPASANLITNTVNVNTTLTTHETVSWTHDFSGHADFGSIDTITGATISVSLTDDKDWWLPDLALGIADSGQWVFGLVETGTYSYSVGVASLYDGVLNVSVTSILGRFRVNSSLLAVNWIASDRPTSVPEPGTLSLLGGGLLLAGFLGRRRRQAKSAA